MVKHRAVPAAEIRVIEDGEWVTFPGGELEGRRPKALCPKCRAARKCSAGLSGPLPLCFECYRTDQAHERALKAAREVFTGSEERFQSALPFEPVNRARLDRLRAERATVRAALRIGAGQFVDKRRHAQIAARHALQRVASDLHARTAFEPGTPELQRQRAMESATHAAELQLPDAWLPFVVSR
jgi:hypothetical protein